ncbi:MAG: hypothetical protein H6738_04305 [Alphaproteobacteria bacterium]|nr:hypothetical protein [Alphaproteobacteria bacterium]MCB9695994.1 hypothetical protein [Alphaproteobacteria bacterium]
MDLMHRAGGPLARRLTGDPNRWARDGALVGLLTGYVGPAVVGLGWTLSAPALIMAGMCAAGGAVLGVCVADVIERSRGRVPLSVLSVALPGLAATLAAIWAGGTAAMTGSFVLPSALFGATFAASLVGLLWLPYTVSTALGLPRWPWVAVGVGLSPAITWLAVCAASLL